MNKLQQKLIENRNMIRREKFLSALDPEFSGLLSQADFNSDSNCIRNAAFPKWDESAQLVTNSRGNVRYWNNFSFRAWTELTAVLNKFSKVKNYIGWFFIDADGPYYRMSLKAFLSHIPSISAYATQNEHYNFGWVGEADDVGIIIEKKSLLSGDRKFNISIWGL